MRITSYTADIDIEHPSFDQARMGSVEPLANLCHKVAKDRNYTEAEEVKLIEIVHAAINRFLEKYPKTRARIVCIQLSVGSSFKSLRFYAEGYAALGASLSGLSSPTGDTFIAETDLYRQEYQQYSKDLVTEAVEDK